jgi:hypothetical protein
LTRSVTLSIINISKVDKEIPVTPALRSGRPLKAIRAFLSLLLAVDGLAVIAAVLEVLTRNNATSLRLPLHLVFGAQRPQSALSTVELTGAQVTVKDPSVAQIVLDLLAHPVAFSLAAIPMIIVAQRLLDRAADTHPFTAEMAAGLRRLGRLILGAGLLALIVNNVAAGLLLHSVAPAADAVTDGRLELELWWLPLGLVVLAFAQIIQHGHSLRAELDQVI